MKVQELRGTLKFLLVYILIILISGFLKTELIISSLPESSLKVARVTSYLSMVVSIAVLIVLFSAVFGLVWYLLQLHNIYVKLEHWIFCLRYFITTMAASEILKFSAIFIFLKDDIMIIEDITEFDLRETTFYFVSNLSDASACIIGIALFSTELRNRTSGSVKTSVLSSLYIMLSLAMVYVIFTS